MCIRDRSWNARTGAVRYSEIYMGETIDTTISEARDREQSGIRTGSVSVMEFDKSTLTAQENESVRITCLLYTSRKTMNWQRRRRAIVSFF